MHKDPAENPKLTPAQEAEVRAELDALSAPMPSSKAVREALEKAHEFLESLSLFIPCYYGRTFDKGKIEAAYNETRKVVRAALDAQPGEREPVGCVCCGTFDTARKDGYCPDCYPHDLQAMKDRVAEAILKWFSGHPLDHPDGEGGFDGYTFKAIADCSNTVCAALASPPVEREPGSGEAITLLEEAKERLSTTCFCGELGAGHEEETEDHHACDQQLTCDAITKFLSERPPPTSGAPGRDGVGSDDTGGEARGSAVAAAPTEGTSLEAVERTPASPPISSEAFAFACGLLSDLCAAVDTIEDHTTPEALALLRGKRDAAAAILKNATSEADVLDRIQEALPIAPVSEGESPRCGGKGYVLTEMMPATTMDSPCPGCPDCAPDAGSE